MIQVNNATIAESDILSEMQYHPAESKENAMKQAAETLIIGELLKQRAEQLELTVETADQQASKNDFIEKLLAHEVKTPEANEEACRQYFESNRHRFTSSPLLEIRHILVAAAPDNDADRVQGKQIAEELITELQNGGALEDLARRYSSCPSKETGGNLGQISRGQTVAEFERQVFPVSEGLIPNPVETRYGFHVVCVDRKIEGEPLPFSAVHKRIADYLNEKVHRKAVAQYIQYLITEAEIEGYDFGVSSSPLMQ